MTVVLELLRGAKLEAYEPEVRGEGCYADPLARGVF